MSELAHHDLGGVAETLLIPLYIRAMESQRPDALLKDEKAVALVTQMDAAFSHIKKIKMDEDDAERPSPTSFSLPGRGRFHVL